MKRILTTAIVLAVTSVAAGSALAQSAAYCDQYARSEMERLYPTGGGAISGAVAGGIIGGLIAGATNNNVGGGVGIGAGAGLVVGSAAWQAKRQQVYTIAYNNCISQAQPVALPPPPPAPPPPNPPYFARTTAASLNVRNQPGTTGSVVMFTVNPSQVFQILSCDNPTLGWCWIDLNGANGWVSRAYTVPAT